MKQKIITNNTNDGEKNSDEKSFYLKEKTMLLHETLRTLSEKK